MKRTFAIIGFIFCIFVAIWCFSSRERTSFNHIQITEVLQKTPIPSDTIKSKPDNQKTTGNNSIEYTAGDSISSDNDMTDLEHALTMTYKMSLYTEAQNQNSSFKIQYPFS